MDEEKYFVASFNEGALEAVYWCKTLDEAKEYAKSQKKKFQREAKDIVVGEILE